jgi:hypothetical protein
MITIIEIAKEFGVSDKALRRACRAAGLKWHHHYERWTFQRGSREERDVRSIAASISG